MADVRNGLVMDKVSVIASNGETLLGEFSYSFQPGITAVLGANGAGKTTLLKALSGDLPYRGKVTLDADCLLALKLANRISQRVAVLPQFTHLQFPLLVEEVVALGLLNRTLSPSQKDTVLKETVESFELSDLWCRDVTQLSGGEQSRVQLARVYAQIIPLASCASRQSLVLLLDEPVSALDVPYQHKIMRLLQAIARRNITVVVVLHDLNLALRYGSNALLLKQGRCVAAGDIESTLTDSVLLDVYNEPIKLVRYSGVEHLNAVFTG